MIKFNKSIEINYKHYAEKHHRFNMFSLIACFMKKQKKENYPHNQEINAQIIMKIKKGVNAYEYSR